jgi:hypothetical protein
MNNYYGDVEVIMKARLRLDADFKKFNSKGRPSKGDMIKMIEEGRYNDIDEEEYLEIIEVVKVGKNETNPYKSDEEE